MNMCAKETTMAAGMVASLMLAAGLAIAAAPLDEQTDGQPRASAQWVGQEEGQPRASAQWVGKEEGQPRASAQLLEVAADEEGPAVLYSSTDTREWQPPTLFAPTAVRVTNDPKGARPGMTLISIDGLDILAPKGLRVEKRGSRVMYEDTGEFIARRFDEFDTAVAELRSEVAALKKELRELRQAEEEGMSAL